MYVAQRLIAPHTPSASNNARSARVSRGRRGRCHCDGVVWTGCAASSPTIQLVRCNSSQHVQVGRPPRGPRGCDQAEHGREHEENDKAGDGDHGVRDALLP